MEARRSAPPPFSLQVACARSVGACIVAIEDDDARNAFKPALQVPSLARHICSPDLSPCLSRPARELAITLRVVR